MKALYAVIAAALSMDVIYAVTCIYDHGLQISENSDLLYTHLSV